MGKYINQIKGKHIGVSYWEKCKSLIYFGAVEIDEPNEFIPNSLVCVMDNYIFASALYCYDESEFNYVVDNPDERPKKWFKLTNANDYAQ